jgi:hypothetical protein
MRILSNVEFEKLAEKESPRLKAIAKHRCDKSPDGFLTTDDIADYAKVCMYSGDHKTANWLKSLAILAKNGKIARLRKNASTWEDHVEQVHMMHRAKEIPFDIGQHVYCKDCERYGSIADYIPDSKEYLVVLDPFQLRTYKKNDLEKVATIKNKE